MAYATETDLLLGDIPLGSGVDPVAWLERAAEEIDSRLGTRYVLPLTGLAVHSELLLKRINAQLATGRLIMALDGGNDNNLHAYGRDLVNASLRELGMLTNGGVVLVGAEVVPDALGNRGPVIRNEDAHSATRAFEAYTSGQNAYWMPGA